MIDDLIGVNPYVENLSKPSLTLEEPTLSTLSKMEAAGKLTVNCRDFSIRECVYVTSLIAIPMIAGSFKSTLKISPAVITLGFFFSSIDTIRPAGDGKTGRNGVLSLIFFILAPQIFNFMDCGFFFTAQEFYCTIHL